MNTVTYSRPDLCGMSSREAFESLTIHRILQRRHSNRGGVWWMGGDWV